MVVETGMLYLSDKLQQEYQSFAVEKLKNKQVVGAVLNARRFPPMDGNAYLKRNSELMQDLGLGHLFDSEEGEPIALSLKELTYVLIVAELSCYGVTMGRLSELKRFFCNELERAACEKALLLALLGQEQLSVLFFNQKRVLNEPQENVVCIADVMSLATLTRDAESYVQVDLSKVVKGYSGNIIGQLKVENGSLDVYRTLFDVLTEQDGLSNSEKEMLEHVRDDSYREIIVRKNDGAIKTFHCTEERESSDLKEIVETTNQKSYREIQLHERAGSLTGASITTTIKPD